MTLAFWMLAGTVAIGVMLGVLIAWARAACAIGHLQPDRAGRRVSVTGNASFELVVIAESSRVPATIYARVARGGRDSGGIGRVDLTPVRALGLGVELSSNVRRGTTTLRFRSKAPDRRRN